MYRLGPRPRIASPPGRDQRDVRRPVAMLSALRSIELDLGDLDRSRFVAATGQSGSPLSRHYHDLTVLWSAGDSVAMTRSAEACRRDIRSIHAARLRLLRGDIVR